MTSSKGVGPAPPPRPTNPPNGPPKPDPGAMQDPATLSGLHSLWQRAMDRAGLTLGDLKAPQDQHVRAA